MRYLTSTLAAITLASAVGVFAQEQQAPRRHRQNRRRLKNRRLETAHPNRHSLVV